MAFSDGPLWARSKNSKNFWGTLWALIRYMEKYRLILYLGLVMVVIAISPALLEM